MKKTGKWMVCGAVIFIGVMTSLQAQYVDSGGEWAGALIPPMTGQASDFQQRRCGTNATMADFRFGVSSSALYRVYQTNLTSAGLTPSAIVGDQMRLFCRDQEVSISMSTTGVFGPGDYMEFYGAGYQGTYTRTNAYWLGWGSSGIRNSIVDAATNAGGTLVTSYYERVWFNPNLLYPYAYHPENETIDHWFSSLLSTQDTVTAATTDDRLSSGQAILTAKIYGGTTNSHTMRITVNGTMVANASYDGDVMMMTTSTFASATLVNGSTPVIFKETTASAKSYLKDYSIDYPRYLKVRNDFLLFNGKVGTNVYGVSGLTTNLGIVVKDVSDPALTIDLINGTVGGGAPGNYTLYFRTVTTTNCRYLVTATNRIPSPPSRQRFFFRNLSAVNNHADYIVICPYSVRRQVYDLLKYRDQRGLKVIVAPTEDIYNEFSYGICDIAAIKQFLGYAFHYWQGSKPRYTCLIGYGTYDPLNRLGLNPPVILPTYEGFASLQRWAALDNWFGTVNGNDNLPDIAIGRIPASTTSELANVVAKIKLFEAVTNKTRNVTLVADKIDNSNPNDVLNFKSASETTIWTNHLKGFYSSSSGLNGYLDNYSASYIRSTIASRINTGQHLVTFFGHGNGNQWCSPDVWNTNDIVQLTNTSQFPIVTMWSCDSGGSHDPTVKTIVEYFLLSTRGSVACVAPSSLSSLLYAKPIADGFFGDFTNTTTRLGDSMQAGLLNLWMYGNVYARELLFYEVFGDPALEKF